MADVFCLPSAGPGETWGLAINEALASGTPCIVSDRAGCSQDIFLQSDHGKPVKWNDKTAWIAAILDMLKTDKNHLEWSNYLQHFRIETFVHAIKTQLNKLESKCPPQ